MPSSVTTEVAPPTEPAGGACDTSRWAVRDQAALMVFAEINAADEAAVEQATNLGVGGIFISTAAVPLLQTQAFGTDIAAAQREPFVAIDEEGGRVQRLRDILGRIPSAREMHATMTPAQITALAQRHGVAMRRLGITMNFAPDADVSDQPADAVIGDRSYSDDPAAVTTDAVAFAQGMASAGVTPVFKHFPGHGRGSGDSHTGLVTTPTLRSLSEIDLVPFVGGPPQVPGAAIMVGHLIVPGLTGGLPATVSRGAITDLLRGQIGFDGLVITDDLGAMRGILDQYGTPVAAAVAAATAGVDMVLVPSKDASATIAAITNAVDSGAMPRAQLTMSANRVLEALPREAC